MPHRNLRWSPTSNWRTALGAAALTAGLLAPAVGVLAPSVAHAAPYSVVTCRGWLSKATPTAIDPNWTNYTFHCSADIQSYTIIENRPTNDFGTIDDFNTAPAVYNDALTQVSPTETAACQATTTPGNGVNCYAVSSANPQVVSAYNWVEGQIDSTDPFCGVNATRKTAAEPAANAQLIVADVTGAQWGPFPLPRTPACPRVKTKAPSKAKGHKTKKSKGKHSFK